MARQSRFDTAAPLAVAARARVMDMIDAVPPEALVQLVKDKPSLRGMVLGNIAELLFERHLPERYPEIRPEHVVGHDDHDRSANKSDRTITYRGRTYAVQVKSIQTGSIKLERESGQLVATLQNDGSDMRTVRLKDGSSVSTTCYVRGEYDILAVPLYPFTGTDAFAYKRNEDCRATVHKAYTPFQRNGFWRLPNRSAGRFRETGTRTCSTYSHVTLDHPSATPMSSRSQGAKFEWARRGRSSCRTKTRKYEWFLRACSCLSKREITGMLRRTTTNRSLQ